MFKKVVVSGVLGFVVLFGWGFVVNGVFGFNKSINMKQIPDERQVYEVLKESIAEPGRYIFNPEMTPSHMFPDGEPVFSLRYSGMGHETAGKLMLLRLVIFLLTPMIAAWLLSQSSHRILSSYPRKVLYFVVIGLLFGLFGDLMNFGIDSYSLKDTLLLITHNISLWTLLGLVVAWRISPESSSITNSPARF